MAKGEVEPAWIPPARPPGGWAEAQHELTLRLANGERLPETPVRVRWWTNPYTWWHQYGGWPGALICLLQMLVRHVRHGPEGTWVALWRRESSAQEPDLVFLTSRAHVPSTDGTAYGAVVGEYAPNGALMVELDMCRILPTHNPQRPYGFLTRRLRS